MPSRKKTSSGSMPGSPTRSANNSGRRWASDVLVLHFPCVVHDVESAVADEEWQRPRSHTLPLAAVVGPHRRDVRLPMGNKFVRRECAAFRCPESNPLREVFAFRPDGVANDRVTVTPSAARALSHIR